ncbi:hypothetical protein AGR7A_Cc230072 [Agrobacterium deltaense NCPPB 1641]|uniref:Uncharacterized protein n=1 Tax=Agrobacterium deltaense NCPPB 1641 TaxID=1183425 RepID=A0A1S7TMM7_9HYPH|nr:hypothetical protein AGR7A_Cc230072 [Agrobacterium deltaense NCPPB 1641]
MAPLLPPSTEHEACFSRIPQQPDQIAGSLISFIIPAFSKAETDRPEKIRSRFKGLKFF